MCRLRLFQKLKIVSGNSRCVNHVRILNSYVIVLDIITIKFVLLKVMGFWLLKWIKPYRIISQ